MSDTTSRARLLWWAVTPLLPTLAIQGSLVRRRIPLLSEARGARRGIAGAGPEALSLAVIGESTAAGVGVATQAQGLAAQLAAAIAHARSVRVRWQVVGRTGLVLAKARRELLPEVDEADVVVAVFGVNDTLKLTSERVWQEELRALVAALLERGVRHVLFTGAPPLDAFSVLPQPLRSVLGVRARFLNALLREFVAQDARTSMVDFERVDPATELAHDGFHPSALGYARWAQLLAHELAPITEQLALSRADLHAEA